MISRINLDIIYGCTYLEFSRAQDEESAITCAERKGWEPDSLEGIEKVSDRSRKEQPSASDSQLVFKRSVLLIVGGFSNSTLVLKLSSVLVFSLEMLPPTLVGSTVVVVLFWSSDAPLFDVAILFETFCLTVDRDFDGKFMKNFPTKRASCCRDDSRCCDIYRHYIRSGKY